MPYAMNGRLVSGVLMALLTLSCTSWNVLAGTHFHKKAVASVHPRYYSYYPPRHPLPSVSRSRGDHELCYLPSEGCDNNHTITN